MWEMVAKEMGLPWRAIEGIHWDMGREEMASRANVPVFQPHANAGVPQRRSPSGPRTNPSLAPAPTPPGDSAGEQQFLPQPARVARARTASISRHRRTSTRRDAHPQLASVFESEIQPQPTTNDPSPSYVSDIPNTPASSAEYNGSPAVRSAPDERPPPPTPPHVQIRSSSHHSSDATSNHHTPTAPSPPLVTTNV